MAVFVRDHTGVSIKTSGTTNIGVNISTATTAGNTLIARILFDNYSTASLPTVTSIAKAAGETASWVFLGAARSTNATLGANASGEMWAIKTTVSWPVAAYTVTLSNAVVMKATDVREFAGVFAAMRSTTGTAYSTSTTAASAVTTGTAPQVGDLAVGFIFGSNVAAAQAGSTNTTGGTWSTASGIGSTGAGAATNNYGVSQYKILTAASHQTYANAAVMTAANGAIVAILQNDPSYVVPKTELITDTFTLDDTTKWPSGSRYNTVFIRNGRVEATELTGPPRYSGIVSPQTYTLMGSSASVKMTRPTVQSSSTETTLTVRDATAQNSISVILYYDPALVGSENQVCMRLTVATVTNNEFLTHNPTTMAYWRVRQSGGNYYWDSSPDGSTWTNRRTLAHALVLDTVGIELSVGQWKTAEPTQNTGYFDNVNLPEAGAVFLPLLGKGSSETAGPTLVVTNTTGSDIAAGTLISVASTWDNTISTTPPVITCSTIGGATASANHATTAGQGVTTTAGSGIWHQCFRARTTAAIAAGGVIATLTSDQSPVKRAGAASGMAGASTTIRSGPVVTSTASGGATPATNFTPTAGDGMFGSVSYESNGAIGNTPGAPTWATMDGIFTPTGGAAINVAAYIQAGVAPNSTTFNYGNSDMWAAGDTIVCIYSVVPGAETVQVAPVASFTASASTVVAGSTLTFTDTSTNTPTSWYWDFGAGASPANTGGQGPHTVTFNTAGTSYVTMEATNAAGADEVDTPTVITVTAASQALTYAKTDNLGLTDSMTYVLGKPKIETFTDDFVTLNTSTKWSVTAARTSIDTERLKFVTVANSAAYSYAASISSFDLRESSVMVEVVDAGNQALTDFEVMALKIIDPTWAVEVGFNLNSNQLTVYNGVRIGPIVAWSAATRWLRIRETAGTVYYEYSATGLAGSWTTMTSHLTSALVSPATGSAVRVLLGCGAWTTAMPASQALFDNVNITPTGQALTLNKTDNLGITDAQTDAITLNRTDLAKPTDTQTDVITQAQSDSLGLTDSMTYTLSPIPIAGLTSWFDADDASTFTYSSGAVVSQWRDKSTISPHHLSQGTVANQPQRNGLQYERATVVFDGTNDFMDTQSFSQPQPVTVFFAFNPGADQMQSLFTSVAGEFQVWIGQGMMSYYAGTVQQIEYVVATPQRWMFTMNGASTTAHRDGIQVNASDIGTTGTATGWRVGAERNLVAEYYLTGSVFEIIAYNRVLTAPEQQEVDNYLVAKWFTPPAGVALTLDKQDVLGITDAQTDGITLNRSDNLGISDAQTDQITLNRTDLVKPTDSKSHVHIPGYSLNYGAVDDPGLTDPFNYVLTPPSVMGSVVNYGQGGDWVTRGWGTAGYMLADVGLRTSLPPFVSGVVTGAARYTWAQPSAEPSAMRLPPPDPSSGQFTWYHDTQFVVTFTFGQAWSGTIRTYFLSHQNDTRSVTVQARLNSVEQNSTILAYNDPATWFGSGQQQPTMLPGGRWIGWEVQMQPGDVIDFYITNTGGPLESANAVVSGYVFDALGASQSWTVNKSDDAGLTDYFNWEKSSANAVSTTDNLGLADSKTSVAALARSDNMPMTDTVTTAAAKVLALTDLAAVTDSITFTLARSINVSDALSVTDSRTASPALARSDTIGLTDPFITNKTSAGAYSTVDLTGLTDSFVWVKPKVPGRPKAHTGTAYEPKPGRLYIAGSWVEKPWKKWNGTTWAAIGGLDPATQAYLTATGLNTSYAPALDGLVSGLKAKGLWSKMSAIYPFIGGTAALHKWNLKDPRDLDAAYRLTFTGTSSSHSTALGYQANAAVGGNGWADTHFVPSATLNAESTHLSMYSLAAKAPAARCDMGSYNWDGATGRFHVIAYYISGLYYFSMGALDMANAAVPASSGLFVSTRTGAYYQAGYRNGVLANSSASGVYGLPNVSMYIGALNSFTTENSDLPFGFASIGSGLSQQENADLYTVVQAYQTALGRAI